MLYNFSECFFINKSYLSSSAYHDRNYDYDHYNVLGLEQPGCGGEAAEGEPSHPRSAMGGL